jgi:hypothetical protein
MDGERQNNSWRESALDGNTHDEKEHVDLARSALRFPRCRGRKGREQEHEERMTETD